VADGQALAEKEGVSVLLAHCTTVAEGCVEAVKQGVGDDTALPELHCDCDSMALWLTRGVRVAQGVDEPEGERLPVLELQGQGVEEGVRVLHAEEEVVSVVDGVGHCVGDCEGEAAREEVLHGVAVAASVVVSEVVAQGEAVAESVAESEPLAHEEDEAEGVRLCVAEAQDVGEREVQEEALRVSKPVELGSRGEGVRVTLLLTLPVHVRLALEESDGVEEGEGEALMLALDVASTGLCEAAVLPVPVALGQEVELREGVADAQGVAVGVALMLALLHPVGEVTMEALVLRVTEEHCEAVVVRLAVTVGVMLLLVVTVDVVVDD
jgi:hypothetical protein